MGWRENRGSPHCCHGNTGKSNCARKHQCVSLFLNQSPRTERKGGQQSLGYGNHPQRACAQHGPGPPTRSSNGGSF